jgi:uncharacterized membrane protein
MTVVTWLPVVCRVLHIAATCTSLGGLFYARTVLLPTVRGLPPERREEILSEAIRRFATIKWTGVTLVASTGLIQWLSTYPRIVNQGQYAVYFVIKMVGAVGLFSITFLLALPSERLQRMQQGRGFWSGVNVVCGLLILVGAALMHSVARR